MTKSARVLGLSSLALGVFVSACAQHSGETVSTATELTEAKVQLAPPITTVKPGASVTFSHPAVKSLDIGENGSVTLTVNEGYPSGVLTLEASGEEGIEVFGAGAIARIDMADATTHSWRVDFQATADGVHYVQVMATAEPKGGLVERRAYAVRVNAGDWASAQAKTQAEKPMLMLEGDVAAVTMEAQETIE